MKIISFNINGIRARLHQLAALIEQHQPDVIGLQETKVADEMFPIDAITQLGYHASIHGQKAHYGVALLSKQPPLAIHKGYPDDPADAQRRLITGQFATPSGSTVTVINGYFPQGENRTHPSKFPAKQQFYQSLAQYLQQQHQPASALVLMGDMNIAPEDADIGIGPDNAKRWLSSGKCSFLPEERAWLTTILDWGLHDCFRQQHNTATDQFSWFDYRSRGFEREPKRGLRIDLLLATEPLLQCCRATGIDYGIRAMEKPSDHCPIWAEFDLA